jgi:Holliday junction resolvase
MGSNYKIGYYYEQKVRKILEKEGYDAWRTPGSHSPIDIIAINKEGKIRLIQVKKNKRDIDINNINYIDLYELYHLAEKYKDSNNVDIELWIFSNNELKKYNKDDILKLKDIIFSQ